MADEQIQCDAPPTVVGPPPLVGRVLLAEDGVDNQVLIGMYLRRAGAQVTIADNGQVAVDLVQAGHVFDVILMDMQMPELDGYSAARALRRRGVATPIIALTAHALACDRQKCIDAGCTDYLAKPVDRHALIQLLHVYLAARGTVPVVSEAAAPLTMEAAVAGFVSRLPERAQQLATLLRERDADALRRAAHQLKGAGSGFGFPQISDAAGRAEQFAAALVQLGTDDATALANATAAAAELLSVLHAVAGRDAGRETAGVNPAP